MSEYVLTAKVGNNNDLFPDVMKLYVPKDGIVLDMTWGNGVFWKDIPAGQYHVYPNDIDQERGDYHYDFRKLPPEWAGMFDAVILDPPYLYTGGFETLKDSVDKGYKNRERAANGIHGVQAVDQMYYDGMKEAHRVLKPDGHLIVKCADQVMSGVQRWSHEVYGQYGEQLGFRREDLFILVQRNQPTMRHKPEQQRHARRNHSYFLVFRKLNRERAIREMGYE